MVSTQTALWIGVAATAIGAGVSAYSSYASGQAQNAIAQFNANQQEKQAKLGLMSAQAQAAAMKNQAEANFRLRAAEAQAKGANAVSLENQALGQDRANRENLRRRREDFARAQGEQRTAIAASGAVEASGTPLDILAETAQTIQRDQEEQHHAGELQRRTIFREAEMERLGGQFALAGATLDRSSGLAEASLTSAAGRGEYLAGLRGAQIERLTGRAAKRAGTINAFGQAISGIGSAYGGYSSMNPSGSSSAYRKLGRGLSRSGYDPIFRGG